jgi:hypothetical protein
MKKQKSMKWPIHVTADTRSPNGRKHKISHYVEGAGDALAAMLSIAACANGRTRGLWLGCTFRAVTPLGQTIAGVLERDGRGNYTMAERVPDTLEKAICGRLSTIWPTYKELESKP